MASAPASAPDPKVLARENRNLKKYLRELTVNVGKYLHALDAVMAERESVERGGRIAQLSNALDIANDQARYFGLGIDFRKDKKRRG